jgi:hypothetical protein
MATLAGQRASFTWALNQYNLAEDADTKTLNAKRMAKVIEKAPENGFAVEQITQKQPYPEAEVAQFLNRPELTEVPPGTHKPCRKTSTARFPYTHPIRQGFSFKSGRGFALDLRSIRSVRKRHVSRYSTAYR